MAGRIRQADVEALKDRADIVDVIGQYTQLKKAGTSWKGLCPFHTERSPSFTVSQVKGGVYHCFGCGESGDVIGFIRAKEGLGFVESVELLARQMNYTLVYEQMSAGQQRALGERSQLVELNEQALAFYRSLLFTDEGAVARDYLKTRGFGREEAERFELGYAPDDWDRLNRKLQGEGASQAQLIRGGLAKQGSRGLLDQFRGRLVFPIRNATNDLIGFGGRVLPGLDYGDFTPPKYLNTPETPLYNKTNVLYGLHLARGSMARASTVLVCEGYTDVMALHQAGFENAVATCGTATGPEHLRVLSRHVERVVLAFDGDEAGAKAAERAWKAAQEHDLDVRVLELPEGLDPADFAAREGADGVTRAVDLSLGVVQFLIRRRIAAQDLSTETGRVQALHTAVALLADVKDPDLRREYARSEIATPLKLSWGFIVESAQRADIPLDAHQGVAGGALRPQRRAAFGAVARANPDRVHLELELLGVALRDPDLLPVPEWDEVAAEDFQDVDARRVFVAIEEAGGVGVPLHVVVDAAPDDEVRGLLRAAVLRDPQRVQDATHVRVLTRRLLLPRARATYEAAKGRLGAPPAAGEDPGARVALVVQLQQRVRELSSGE